jgi:hypothetical protein
MFHHHTHTMSLTTYREVCADLLRGLGELKHPRFSFPFYITAAMCRARELLAQPTPAEPADHIRDGTEMVAPPAEGEVGELAAQLGADAECVEAERYDLCNMTADQMRRAATLLQQQAAELAALRQERPHA